MKKTKKSKKTINFLENIIKIRYKYFIFKEIMIYLHT